MNTTALSPREVLQRYQLATPLPREVLQRYQLPRGLRDAQDYLYRVSLSLHMLQLYQHFFPEDYANCTARAFPQDDEAYSPRETRFLTLVDERLFPIHIDFLLDCATAEERNSVIPACTLGRTTWEEDLADMPDTWHIALFLAGEISAEDFDTYHPDLEAPDESPLRGAQWQSIDWDAFFQQWADRTANLHPAFATVPLAIEVGVHDTGNAFIDPTEEVPLDTFFWNLEDVQILVDHYRQAEEIFERIEALLDWLGEDPQHLSDVLSHLRACLHLRASAPNNQSHEDELEEIDDSNDN